MTMKKATRLTLEMGTKKPSCKTSPLNSIHTFESPNDSKRQTLSLDESYIRFENANDEPEPRR